MIALAKVKTQGTEKIKLPSTRGCSPIPDNEYHDPEFPAISHFVSDRNNEVEVNIEKQGRQMHCSGDSVREKCVSRNIPDTETSSESSEQVSEEADVPCSQDECDSGRCMASGVCPGVNVLHATKEVFGKEQDEVDKPDEDGVQSPGDSVQPLGVRRDICNLERSSESSEQVSEEEQSRPQDPFYPSYIQ